MWVLYTDTVMPKRSFLEKLLAIGIIGIFALLPLLYFPNRIASYVTSKQYFLIGTVDVLLVAWVWLLLHDTRYRLGKKNLLVLAPSFIFLACLTVSAFAGVDPSTSFFSTVESGTGLVVLYHIFALCCMIASLLRVQQKKLLRRILQGNFFASAVLAIATFFTGPNGLIEINSQMLDKSSGGAMMGNLLLVGAYFIFSVFLTVILITQERKVYKKIIYYLGIAVIIFSPIYFNVLILKGESFSVLVSSGYFFLGQARIASVALIGGSLASLFIWLNMEKTKKLLRIVGITGTIIGVAVFACTVVEIAIPSSHLHHFFVTQGGNRTIDWKEAIQGIKEKPLLGWGPENYHVVYQRYLNPIVFSPGHGNEVWALHPHNNSLEVLVDGGLIGFTAYVLMVVMLFMSIVRLYRKGVLDNKVTALLIGMLIAFILQQQMIYDSIVSYTMFFFIITLIAGLSETTSLQRGNIRVLLSYPSYCVGIGVTIIMIPVWIYGAYFPARKVEEFHRIAGSYSEERTDAYYHLFHSVGSYAINTDPEFYTDPLLLSYNQQKALLRNNPIYQKKAVQEITSLLDSVNPIWQKQPYNYHLSISLLQLENLRFYLTGDPAVLVKADEYAERALSLSPTDPQIYFYYAQTLVYEHNVEKAKMMLATATRLNPDYKAAEQYRLILEKL